MPVRTLAAVTLAATMLSGCTLSLHEIRQQPPARIGLVPGDYAPLTQCVADGLRAHPKSGAWTLSPNSLLYSVTDWAAERRATITGQLTGGLAPPTTVIDLTLVAISGGVTRIESRWGGTAGLHGSAHKIDEEVWPVVERCTGAKVEVTAR